TGHGVQAALKAFASNMIAKTIWLEDHPDGHEVERRKMPSRLQKYDQLVDRLICHSADEIPDFNAMIGAEFMLESHKVELYRANYGFPLLIEPQFDWAESKADCALPHWRIVSLALPNRTVTELELKAGALLVLVS